MVYLIILLNIARFIGLEYSPPGFYMDEAAGATQVICIAQTGFDFYGVHFPLFAAGFPGFGLYTPTYLYGQVAWTSLFGNSIAAFRGFSAFVTTLTILFLYLFARKVGTQRMALYVAFAATIMPWAFQFSRIAWDPPIAVMFLIAALWVSTFKRFSWCAGLILALAAYSYPPMRITALVLWVLLPGISVKNKTLTLGIAFLACIPLWFELRDPEFMGRARSLAIWGVFYDNPFEKWGLLATPILYVKQLLSHFSPSFLFFNGDQNLRHSIQTFGMLSWVDGIALIASGCICLKNFFGATKIQLSSKTKKLFYISLIGILIGITPAALTNEGLPHALRSLAAWPFFALLTGVFLSQIETVLRPKIVMASVSMIGLVFFGAYQYSYFTRYPNLAQNAFWVGYSPIATAYYPLAERSLACKDLPSPVIPIGIGETIYFSNQNNTHGNGHQFLRNHWAEQEEWGIWTYGKGADLVIDLPSIKPTKIVFQVRALVGPKHPTQNIAIWMDGKLYKEFALSQWANNTIELNLSNLTPNQKKVWIEFRVLNPVSPVGAGISETDRRPLGVGLESAIFN